MMFVSLDANVWSSADKRAECDDRLDENRCRIRLGVGFYPMYELTS
jgi:hypothetical protein